MSADLKNTLWDASQFAWWEWEIPSNTVRFNRLKAEMIGYDPADFEGRGFEAFTGLLHPDDYDRTMDAMRAVLFHGAPLYQVDYRIRAKDDSWHWYMDRGTVTERNDEGFPLRMRGLVIDLAAEGGGPQGARTVLRILDQSVEHLHSGCRTSLVLCSVCGKVKANNLTWVPLSESLVRVVGETVSHGLCPGCLRSLYPEYADKILARIGTGP